jgi:thiol-disulfide isomerase/thioredoxin
MLICSITACDRYEHEFAPLINPFEEFVNAFITDLSNGLANDSIDPIMAYYSDNYLHNGLTKEDVTGHWDSLANVVTDELNILIESIEEDSLKFTYNIVDPGASIDTTLCDCAAEYNEGYILIGNQQAPIETQNVLVELFTGTWCPNCPDCEAELHRLKTNYGDRFYYIEYHIMDELDSGNSDIMQYYGVSSAPTAIFQGHIKLSGGEASEEYEDVLQNLIDLPARGSLRNLLYTIEGDTLYGSVEIELIDNQILTHPLSLQYAIIEETSGTTNYAGEPCRQVVLTRGNCFVQEDDLSAPIAFFLPLTEVQIPNDAELYVWLQTRTDVYNPDLCKVYNVITTEISESN